MIWGAYDVEVGDHFFISNYLVRKEARYYLGWPEPDWDLWVDTGL